jgi:hypothetical protein
MGAAKQTCDLCHRAPGEQHGSRCARSRYQQARLGAALESEGAPRWKHVSAMLVTDTEIENIGEHQIPAGGPRSGLAGVAYYRLPGDTYSKRPGAGGRPSRPKLARFAFMAPAPRRSAA